MTTTKEQVKEFQTAIGTAAWKMDLWRFAEVVGHDADHDWTKDKFKQLNALSKSLSAFDADLLTKVINAS